MPGLSEPIGQNRNSRGRPQDHPYVSYGFRDAWILTEIQGFRDGDNNIFGGDSYRLEKEELPGEPQLPAS